MKKLTQRLIGFEPLEPRTVLSAAGLSHFSGDDFSSHGKGATHGMGAYERELRSAAEVNRGPQGKGVENERYGEASRYETSRYVQSAMSTSSSGYSDETHRFTPISRPSREPVYSLPNSTLDKSAGEGEQTSEYSLPSALGRSYTEMHETERLPSGSIMSGSIPNSAPGSYAAASPILRDTAEDATPPTYSVATEPSIVAAARQTVIDASPAPALSNYGPKVQSLTTEVVVARTYDTVFAPSAEARVITAPASVASTARLAAEAIASAALNYIRSFVPMIVVVSPERRADGPTSVSFSGLRESVSYVVPARLNGSLALSVDAEAANSKSTALALTSFLVSLALNSSTSAQADMADRANVVASGDERLNGQAAAGQADASDAAGMIDVESAELLRQKRKAATENALSRPKLSAPLERLEDLPAVREAPPLLREIMQLACDAAMTNLYYESLPSAAHMGDDGMIELLATDVASLVSRGNPVVANSAPSRGRVVTLDAGVAAYQAFEVGSVEAAAPDGATGGDLATAKDATPAPEQLARVE